MATPDLDARLLMADALGCDAAGLILQAEKAAGVALVERLEARIGRRLRGEPVHRILGRRAFYDHEFALSPETLEPRPDTEILVDLCRGPIEAACAARGTCLLVDVGTGTGAIAVSLLAAYPGLVAVAVDLSFGALATARANARASGVGERFLPVASDYLAALAGPFDLVVSNPPYIPSLVIDGLTREVRDFDPRLALDGGADGLDAYRALSLQSAPRLAARGQVLVEIGKGQGDDVAELFRTGGLVLAASAADLSGTTRALRFERAT